MLSNTIDLFLEDVTGAIVEKMKAEDRVACHKRYLTFEVTGWVLRFARDCLVRPNESSGYY